MVHENIDVDNLSVTGAQPVHADQSIPLSYGGDVIVVINQAFGPKGHNLVGLNGVTFDGYPAITLFVRGGNYEGFVHLSPIHGDARKFGLEELDAGTKCQLFCPVSRTPLDRVGAIDGGPAEYCALYLTPKLERGSMVYLSDVWDHHHSRIVDHNELISTWVAAQSGS